MKFEHCKECRYFQDGEFCTKFSVPIPGYNHMRQTVYIPIICIPECEYVKNES